MRMLNETPVVTDPDGRRVLLANPETKGTVADRAWHLIASHAKGDAHKRGPRFFNSRKARSALATAQTVTDYQVIGTDGRQTFYFRRYGPDLHMVITAPDGTTTEHGFVDESLITQREVDATKGLPEVKVVKTRQAAQTSARPRPGTSQAGNVPGTAPARGEDAVTPAEVKANPAVIDAYLGSDHADI